MCGACAPGQTDRVLLATGPRERRCGGRRAPSLGREQLRQVVHYAKALALAYEQTGDDTAEIRQLQDTIGAAGVQLMQVRVGQTTWIHGPPRLRRSCAGLTPSDGLRAIERARAWCRPLAAMSRAARGAGQHRNAPKRAWDRRGWQHQYGVRASCPRETHAVLRSPGQSPVGPGCLAVLWGGRPVVPPNYEEIRRRRTVRRTASSSGQDGRGTSGVRSLRADELPDRRHSPLEARARSAACASPWSFGTGAHILSAAALLEAYSSEDVDDPSSSEQARAAQAEATVRHLETELSHLMLENQELRMQLHDAYVVHGGPAPTGALP